MAAKTIVRITTEDTKKTYELPGENIPQLWEVTLTLRSVSQYGRAGDSSHAQKTIHVERQTLVNAGLLPVARDDAVPGSNTETAEDLILRLLEHVGIYPSTEES